MILAYVYKQGWIRHKHLDKKATAWASPKFMGPN